MARAGKVLIQGAVEGDLDEAVLRKLIGETGGSPGHIFGKKGKGYLRQSLNAFRMAARHAPWVVIVDLNLEAKCAPALLKKWQAKSSRQFCFRVAVREIEAWLLADRDSFSTFFHIDSSRIPADPEAERDPKGTVVRLAQSSEQKEIREDMAPRPGSGRSVGPAYTSRMIEYVNKVWRPEVAARSAQSLERALKSIKRLGA